MSRLLSGNQAIAYAALEEGVALVTGYPGTPSTEALTEIEHPARRGEPSPYVEWSVNEKVAFELAAGAAWAGKRALVTMKMSGANVALDALIGVAHSGVNGGLVVYVADDPLSCVARGSGMVLENFDILQKTLASMQRGSTLH